MWEDISVRLNLSPVRIQGRRFDVACYTNDYRNVTVCCIRWVEILAHGFESSEFFLCFCCAMKVETMDQSPSEKFYQLSVRFIISEAISEWEQARGSNR
jgi:hypothetical protein